MTQPGSISIIIIIMSQSEPWEALDVDDSDLSAFLRPCKRHHSHYNPNSNSPPSPQSQSQTLIPLDSPSPPPLRPLIPGPAGAVQAAMMHRRSHTSPEEPLPTQEFIRRVVQNGHESDYDFTTNAWLSAFHFLRSQGLLYADAEPPATPLNSIRNLVNARRVDQVVAVIKSCTPNGFGDMMVTLKDPTGTISATVHHKVFTEGQFGKDISVGSVLVLQKVAVFSPTRSSCYLNITLNNLVKVFSKDCEPPTDQIDPALPVTEITPDTVSKMLGNAFSLPQDRTEGDVMASRGLALRSFATERHEKSMTQGTTVSLPQGRRTEGIMTNLRLDSMFRVVVDVDKQKVENLGVASYHSGNKNTDLEKVSNDGEIEIEMDGHPNHPKFGEGDDTLGRSEARDHPQSQRDVSNPISSIPQWTDEQLDELLAFD